MLYTLSATYKTKALPHRAIPSTIRSAVFKYLYINEVINTHTIFVTIFIK